MKINRTVGLVALAVVLLAACNEPAKEQLITGDHPAPPAADTTASPDTTAPIPGRSVPFVNPTKTGRAMGEQSPSPPASRSH